jgi:hypothetical protein
MTGDGSIDLGGDTRLAEMMESVDSGLKGAGLSAELVVAGGVGAVEGNRHTLKPDGLDARRHRFVDERTVSDEVQTKVVFAGMAGDGEEIAPPEGFAAEEDNCHWGK